MNVQVETSRDGATANIDENTGMLAIKGLSVIEFLCPGRVTSKIPRSDTKLLPGTLYKVLTGVSITKPALVNFASLVVRPTPEYFGKGMDVKRVDLGKKGELIVAVTVLEGVMLEKDKYMFEISLAGTEKPTGLAITATSTTEAKGILVQAKTIHDNLPPQSAPVASQSDAKKVTDWLNSAEVPTGAVRPVVRPVPQAYRGNAEVKAATGR
jgi:hypothetical protein